MPDWSYHRHILRHGKRRYVNLMLLMAAHPNWVLLQPHPSVVTRRCRAIESMHATRSKNVVLWAATSVACTLRLSLISGCIIGHSLTAFDPKRETANAAAVDYTTAPTRNDKSCGETLPGEACRSMQLHQWTWREFCPSWLQLLFRWFTSVTGTLCRCLVLLGKIHWQHRSQ